MQLERFNAESGQRRVAWFKANKASFPFLKEPPLDAADNLLLTRFKIDYSQARIVQRMPGKIIFHSKNFCPTLEACRILNYDTSFVCRHYNENATEALIKQLDGRLRFRRNYQKLRPCSDYCEEMILWEDAGSTL